MDIYKTQDVVESIDDIKKLLNKKFGNKYLVKPCKSDLGSKKFFTGSKIDSVYIRKNGSIGMILALTPPTEGVDYSVIGLSTYISNLFIRVTLNHMGSLGKTLFRKIWNRNNDFYQDIRDLIEMEFNAKEINTSMENGFKMLKNGKSVLDD